MNQISFALCFIVVICAVCHIQATPLRNEVAEDQKYVNCVEDMQANCEEANIPFQVLIQGQSGSRFVRSLLSEDSVARKATDPKKRSTITIFSPKEEEESVAVETVEAIAESPEAESKAADESQQTEDKSADDESSSKSRDADEDKKLNKREADSDSDSDSADESGVAAVIELADNDSSKDGSKKDESSTEPTVGQALLPLAPLGLKFLPLQLGAINLGAFRTNLGLQKNLLKTNTLLPLQVKLAGLKTRLGLLPIAPIAPLAPIAPII
ncbi:RNA polymerase-associated protein LEO1-like [Contarinia nasturtii]|uniref:RNA polymerase-associated protein LEO1-like n=1 Tax=Contarinia nasturtii TaxID=265458 RepID=UPI0012D3C39A|nr:RNA polymerase-associated protein LEO1-like [Contarinia nasturtii]